MSVGQAYHSPALRPLLDEFSRRVEACTIQTTSERPVILTDRLIQWLSTPLDGLGAKTAIEELADLLGIQHAFDKANENALSLFCVLLHMGIPHHFQRFLSERINSIPVRLPTLEPLRNELGSRKINEFYKTQWRFCAGILELDGYNEWEPEVIIPICRQRLVGQGQTARVHAVLVPETFVGPQLRKMYSKSQTVDEESCGGLVRANYPFIGTGSDSIY
jgi:hypothetical protein